MIKELFKAGKGFGEAVLVSIFGWVTLDPPALTADEKNLGELNSFELFLLNFKKSLAMSKSKLLLVGAAVVNEVVAFFLRMRLSIDTSKIGFRKSGKRIVIVPVDSVFEGAALVVAALLIGAQDLLKRPIYKKQTIKVVDSYALRPSEDGEDYHSGSFGYALFATTSSVSLWTGMLALLRQ